MAIMLIDHGVLMMMIVNPSSKNANNDAGKPCPKLTPTYPSPNAKDGPLLLHDIHEGDDLDDDVEEEQDDNYNV